MFLFNSDLRQISDRPGGKWNSAGGKSDPKPCISDEHNGLT